MQKEPVKIKLFRTSMVTLILVAIIVMITTLWKTNIELENRITQNEYCIAKLITAYNDVKKDERTMTEEISSRCPYIQLEN